MFVFIAAVGAGCVNTIVGSGTLITFPVLLAAGLPPLAANVTNNLGLVAGSVTATWRYRELIGQVWPQARRLIAPCLLGASLGAALLLVAPSAVFGRVVPVLIAASIVAVALGPRITRRIHGSHRPPAVASGFGAVIVGTSLYGGYFGAAQGVLLLALMGILTPWSVHTANGVKNLLAALCNAVAAVVFGVAATSHIHLPAAGCVAAGAVLGALVGASVGKRLPAAILRGVIVVVGLVALWILMTSPT